MLKKVRDVSRLLVIGGLVLLTFSGCQRTTNGKNAAETAAQKRT